MKMFFVALLFLTCNSSFSQKVDCIEFDSVQYLSSDTMQFQIKLICKSNLGNYEIYTCNHNAKEFYNGKYYIYENFKLKEEGTMENGKRVDNMITYYSNKIIKEYFLIINDSVTFQSTFYKSGVIESIGTTINGKETGKWLYYYENGILKEVGNYILLYVSNENFHEITKLTGSNGVSGNSVSIKDGNWIFYKENGEIKEITNYDSTKLIK